jgi:adenosylcobinamide-GDP ribazoletransferase
MKSLLAALQFLTIIPVKIKELGKKEVAEAMAFFPLVGLLLGAILTGIYLALSYLGLAHLATSIILVVALIILTGGIHLDGLSDTLDAFLSHKDREEMLKIMRDAHPGVMGILGIISVVLLKIAFLVSLAARQESAVLLLMCILSRWAMVFALYLFPYARQEGKAKVFFEGMNRRIFFLATVFTFILTLLIWGPRVLFLFGLAAFLTYLIGALIRGKISGLTGDSLGAINEIIETAVLAGFLLVTKLSLFIK